MHWTPGETNDLESAVILLRQDRVDHMDWDLIHSHLVQKHNSRRSKKQLQEKLPNGQRFKFSLEQIDYIREQRDTHNKSWAEIRDALNKDPCMEVKTTPNRVKNAYHNATKKRLRNQRQNIQDAAVAKSTEAVPLVYKKVFEEGHNAYYKNPNIYNEADPHIDNESIKTDSTNSTNYIVNREVNKTYLINSMVNHEIVKTDSANSIINKASLDFILNEKDREKKE
ncbi:1835_t:CDS:2 [Dentiscutata erythropus]|uniref:1835_t:CDS:1 n=1 Tax=Dentiscutata erythropus TaxID=1348616 RepID=A0A9N9BF70_9GLOM|nr:1835_t:CDS:2 [Dentiscutata erythropus]